MARTEYAISDPLNYQSVVILQLGNASADYQTRVAAQVELQSFYVQVGEPKLDQDDRGLFLPLSLEGKATLILFTSSVSAGWVETLAIE